MSYLGLDLDNLIWEIKSLISNCGESPNKDNFDKLFDKAKQDILLSFIRIIEDNKEEVLNDFDFSEVEE